MRLLQLLSLPLLLTQALLGPGCERIDSLRFSSWSRQRRTTCLYGLDQGRRLISQGMASFRQGQVKQSIDLFDAAQMEEPRLTPYLWQRGLSYYYANDFVQARKQFRTDVQVNPLDVEEIVWEIASSLRQDPTQDFPLKDAMALPRNQQDRRPIMATVYRLFRGEASERDLAEAGHSTGKASDEFYSLFYLGLFAEARQENSKAEQYMKQAVMTPYAQGFGSADYMTSVAKVHCQLRGWM